VGFFSRLETRAQEVDSLLCIGLDPHLPELHAGAAATAQDALDFCLRLVEATADLAAAYKPNSAFFEVFGAEGMAALRDLIAACPPGVPVVLDAKRGDIASTAQAYARAAFQTLGASAITLSPYLGRDSLAPFLEDAQRGVFLLCKTSNPGSADLQDLWVAAAPGARAERTTYEQVALLAQAWNTGDNLGLVVGATHPQALQRVRALAPGLWFLSPGVGAQGGDLPAALNAGLRSDGLGMLVPVSRLISQSADPAQAARSLCDEINRARAARLYAPGASARPALLAGNLTALADGLLEAGCVKFGQFTLKSGLQSPIYIDLRLLVGFPALLDQAAAAYADILDGLKFERLAALPYAALPVATAISLQRAWPVLYPRKEVKSYGTRAEIEGPYRPGERVVVIDDLATTGESKFEAIEKLEAAGLIVEDVVVLIDRQSGAAQALTGRRCRMHAVFTLATLLDYWQAAGRISDDQAAAARQFIAASGRA
jgi:uridine monophosphate synthetase